MGNVLKVIKIFVFTLGVGFLLSGTNAQAEVKEPEACLKCHEEEVKTFTESHHKKAWAQKEQNQKNSCSTCHGDGEAHIQNKGHTKMPVYYKGKENDAKKANETCLKCHSQTGKLAFWNAGKHGQNDMTCGNCHNLHGGPKVSVIPGPEKCFTCHKDVERDANKLSHHPIIEGKVTCQDCHNPHGTLNKKMMVAETNNQLCYKCHVEKRGPFLWEHSPVEENCLTCHDVHGSRNAKMLVEKAPNLCQNCHEDAHAGNLGANYGFNSGAANVNARSVGRGCVNCHTMIHGSMAPADNGSGTGAAGPGGLQNFSTHKNSSGNYFLR